MTGNTKWLVAALLAAMILPAAAQAEHPYCGYGFGWQSGYGQGVFPGYGPRPPYFALYPPVYYNHEIVRRPMGQSPFAYPSWYTPPRGMAATPAPQPIMVTNTFVKGNESVTGDSKNVESLAPYRMENPHVARK